MPFLPIGDENPRILIDKPVVTWSVIAGCVMVFLFQLSLDTGASRQAALSFGLIPAVLTGEAELRPDLAVIPAWLTIVTSMFMHGGFGHLLSNMLFLGIFGDNVEDAMGHRRFVVFYLVCGAVAAMTHVFVAPAATTPMIGASGAVSGVLGAYLLLHPKAWVTFLVFIFPFTLPAWVLLGGWFIIQFFSAVGATGGGVAWWAHVGGFVAGLVLVSSFRHHTIPLGGGGRQPKGVRLKRRRNTPPGGGGGPWA
jgi:membrane associated rhomboid family serine protease